MSLIKGIHHVALKCTCPEEYEKTLHFYCEVLGMPVLRSWATGTMLDTGCGILEIFNNGDPALEQGAIRHFALLTDSVDACTEAVMKAGYSVFVEPGNVTIPSQPGYPIRRSFCRGPMGEEIEFFEEL